MVRTRSLTAAASEERPRSGLAAAITRWPSATSGSMTCSQLADSAKAPWTSTMVGRMAVPFRSGQNDCDGRPSASPAASVGPLVRAPASRGGELPAGADAELREHLVEVVLDGARPDEQLGADLRVRVSPLREQGDLSLLRREDVAGLDCEPADRLARGRQLAPGALGERLAPIRLRVSCAARSCVRASTRRC